MDQRTRAANALLLPESDLRTRLEEWRKTRPGRYSPIPEALWDAAVELARIHGVGRMSRSLRLHYTSLKRRVLSVDESGTSEPTFVELSLREPETKPSECVVEMERPDGGRMKVRGVRARDLTVLSETFWGCRP
jgi:hypothetical protein